ncbi:unnamed protein product, partial [Pelagomonas calceolata]
VLVVVPLITNRLSRQRQDIRPGLSGRTTTISGSAGGESGVGGVAERRGPGTDSRGQMFVLGHLPGELVSYSSEPIFQRYYSHLLNKLLVSLLLFDLFFVRGDLGSGRRELLVARGEVASQHLVGHHEIKSRRCCLADGRLDLVVVFSLRFRRRREVVVVVVLAPPASPPRPAGGGLGLGGRGLSCFRGLGRRRCGLLRAAGGGLGLGHVGRLSNRLVVKFINGLVLGLELLEERRLEVRGEHELEHAALRDVRIAPEFRPAVFDKILGLEARASVYLLPVLLEQLPEVLHVALERCQDPVVSIERGLDVRDKFFDGPVRDPALVGRSQERPHSRNVGKPAGDDEVVPGGVLRLASLAQLFAVRLHIARRVLVILDRLEGALDVARAGRPGIVHLRPRGQLLGQQRG